MKIDKKENSNQKKVSLLFILLIRPLSLMVISLFLFESKLMESKEIEIKPLSKINKIELSREYGKSKPQWEIYLPNKKKNSPYWKRLKEDEELEIINNKSSSNYLMNIGVLNRSIVFYDKLIGPDISWIVPIGLKWNKKFKYDFTVRGHNTQIPEPPTKKFFGWNEGDAVGLFSYQFLHRDKSSLGLNIGIRSLYQGTEAAGGATPIGEGLSAGFRWDYSLSNTSGFAFGAEQLVHFDNLTDTGRNLYLTFSKAWWNDEFNGTGIFPLDVVTAGIGTGRMAVGTIKGFCSDLFGGSGTEIYFQRSLCWAPIFSLARVWNHKVSTFFEYNSRFFLLGSSIAPSQSIPIRGTFALLLSDHTDNYKLHNGSEMNWVFNISLGL